MLITASAVHEPRHSPGVLYGLSPLLGPWLLNYTESGHFVHAELPYTYSLLLGHLLNDFYFFWSKLACKVLIL